MSLNPLKGLKPKGLGPLKPLQKGPLKNPLKADKTKKSKKSKKSQQPPSQDAPLTSTGTTVHISRRGSVEITQAATPSSPPPASSSTNNDDTDDDDSYGDAYDSDAWEEMESKRESKRQADTSTPTITAAPAAAKVARATPAPTPSSPPATTTHPVHPTTSHQNEENDQNTSRQSIASTTSPTSSSSRRARRSHRAATASAGGQQRLSTNVRRRLLALDQSHNGAVSLADACLGDYGCKAVAERLKTSTATSLDLRGNQIRDEGELEKEGKRRRSSLLGGGGGGVVLTLFLYVSFCSLFCVLSLPISKTRCCCFGASIDNQPFPSFDVVGVEFIGAVSRRISCIGIDLGIAEQYVDVTGFTKQPFNGRRRHGTGQCIDNQPELEHTRFTVELTG